MPANRTSIGTALNDTAQEVGTSVGTAVVGTLVAVLVTTQLPAGTWSDSLVASFFRGERLTYALLAVVVGIVTAWGALSLTDSRAVEEPSTRGHRHRPHHDRPSLTGVPAGDGPRSGSGGCLSRVARSPHEKERR